MMKPTIHAARGATTAPRVIVSLAVAAAIVIAAIAFAIHFLAVRVPLDLAHGAKEETFDSANRMANSFKSVFNFTPQVTVNGTTVVEQATPVMELATAKQDVVEHYQWSQSWFGSTKTMELQGIYQAKAGFDLHDSFRIAVEKGHVIATLPKAKLLSIEMTGYKVLVDDDGWWNKINDSDRENAIAAMQQEARSKATESGLLDEAQSKFEQQLGKVMEAQNMPILLETKFGNEAPGKIIQLPGPLATPASAQ